MQIKLFFKPQLLNGQGLILQIKVGSTFVRAASPMLKSEVVDLEIELPNTIEMQVSGKSHNDTIVSQTGEIDSDKHILLEKMEVNNLMVPKHLLEKHVVECIEGLVQYTNYLGSNGVAKINIPHQTGLRYFLHLLSLESS